MDNHKKTPQHISNLNTPWLKQGGPGGKKKKKKKRSGSSTPVGSTAPNSVILPNTTLNQITITAAGPAPVVKKEAVDIEKALIKSFEKDLTRITVDRSGKRALFSNSTGKIADNLQANTPESKKTNTSSSVQQVLKNWNMFKTPNTDEIT